MHKTFTEYPLALFSSYEKYVDKCKELLQEGYRGYLSKDEFLWHQEYAPQYSFIVLRAEHLASAKGGKLYGVGIPATIHDTAANIATITRAVDEARLRYRGATLPNTTALDAEVGRMGEVPQREADQPEVEQATIDDRTWHDIIDRVRRDTQAENAAIRTMDDRRRELAVHYGARPANVEDMIQDPNWVAFTATHPGLPIEEEDEGENTPTTGGTDDNTLFF